MDLRIDHVTVAGRSLDALRDAFAAAGLDTTEGGAHSNGVTHMATLTLPDGSYLELVSTVEEGAASPWWDAAIRTDAGPCAWAVRVDDAAATAAAMRERGVAVEGPVEYARERPDGVVVEWELVYLGDGEPGSLLPFCIADTTPRAERAGEPSPGVGPTAVRTVVVAVPDLAAATDRLRAAFDLAAPVEGRANTSTPASPGFRTRRSRWPRPATAARSPSGSTRWGRRRVRSCSTRNRGWRSAIRRPRPSRGATRRSRGSTATTRASGGWVWSGRRSGRTCSRGASSPSGGDTDT
ncbi:VOC family protein [Halosegnis marinus]|uniref:VOC family protein n=1 Tax=Halosegnis marinus TaxID=3034023 RepID=UPI003618F5D6